MNSNKSQKGVPRKKKTSRKTRQQGLNKCKHSRLLTERSPSRCDFLLGSDSYHSFILKDQIRPRRTHVDVRRCWSVYILGMYRRHVRLRRWGAGGGVQSQLCERAPTSASFSQIPILAFKLPPCRERVARRRRAGRAARRGAREKFHLSAL